MLSTAINVAKVHNMSSVPDMVHLIRRSFQRKDTYNHAMHNKRALTAAKMPVHMIAFFNGLLLC